jgi:hypothetical protein
MTEVNIPTATRIEFRQGMKPTLKAAVGSKDNIPTIDKVLLDETLAGYNITPLDWSNAPNTSKMSTTQAREAIKDFITAHAADQFPAETRGPQMGTTIKQENAAKSTEQLASDVAALERRMKIMGDRYKRPDVNEMMAEVPSDVFPNKAAFDEQVIIDKLSDNPTIGSYIEGNKIIAHEPISYAGWPEGWVKSRNLPETKITATDIKTGERVPVGKDWTDADPKPVGVQVREKLNKKKG